jgi:hypothetical protein
LLKSPFFAAFLDIPLSSLLERSPFSIFLWITNLVLPRWCLSPPAFKTSAGIPFGPTALLFLSCLMTLLISFLLGG